jgi:hypothetical protein
MIDVRVHLDHDFVLNWKIPIRFFKVFPKLHPNNYKYICAVNV